MFGMNRKHEEYLKKKNRSFLDNETNSTFKYYGFCVDILLELANRLNFTFEIEIVKDRTYGKKNEKGEWNGIIGELVYRVSHDDLIRKRKSINCIRELI